MKGKTREISKYDKYARLTRIFRLIIIMLLVIFAIVMLIFGRKYLTSSNLMFFAKNMSIEPFVSKDNYKDITFDNYYETQFYNYDNKIAIYDNDEIFIYNPSGVLINKIDTNGKVKIDTSGKYICVYDNTRCDIYSSFSKMIDISAPLGEYILKVSSDDYNYITMLSQGNANASAVRVYMNNFGLIYEWKSSDKYVVSTSIKDNGKNIAILSKIVNGGVYSTYLTVANIRTGDILYTEEFENELPVEVKYTNNRITMVTDKHIRFCDKDDYKWKSSDSFANYDNCYLFDTRICTVSLDNYGKRLVNVYSINGDSYGYCEYDCQIIDIKEVSGKIYLQCADGNVYRQNNTQKELVLSGNSTKGILNINGIMYYYDYVGCYIIK